MAKITALHGGGGFAGASAEYLVLPEGLDIEAENTKWRRWYRDEYCALGSKLSYVSLYEWLKKAGGREPTPDELTIYEAL